VLIYCRNCPTAHGGHRFRPDPRGPIGTIRTSREIARFGVIALVIERLRRRQVSALEAATPCAHDDHSKKAAGRLPIKSQAAFFVSLAALSTCAAAAQAQAPSWTPPPDSARCPSKWGAADERGSANHMKPQTVLNATKLIKTGEVIELGHTLNA